MYGPAQALTCMSMYLQVDVPDIGPDEVVRVLDDAEKVMSLQLSAGIEWKEDTFDVRSTVLN